MGQVVRDVAFGKPTVASSDRGEAIPDENTRADIMADDVQYVCESKENRKRIREACEAGDEITKYIFSMFDFHKMNASIVLRQGTLKSTSLKDLCGYLIDSTEHQWNTQPHYIGAVILEMNSRLSFVQEECPDIKVPRFLP